MSSLPRRIALVYDSVNKWGGAEQVLLSLHQLFPEAPLYTSVYNSESAPWARVFPQVIPSFLQRFPLASSHRDFYPWLTPLAFESLNFTGYDAVISVTSADAKSIITPPGCFHFCYCLTPTRYLWSHGKHYQQLIPFPLRYFSRPVFNYLRRWDQIAAARPDFMASISQTTASRVKNFYHRPSPVIYPPVDFSYLASLPPLPLTDNFLYLGRLVAYKNPELIIRSFNQLRLPLIVAGAGPLLQPLKSIAKSNINFLGFVSENQKAILLRQAQALIAFHEEDFGIVPVEAQASGCPVIALNKGGVAETVVSGKTGILIDEESESALIKAVREFNRLDYKNEDLIAQASRFSSQRFSLQFVKIFSQAWKKYLTTYSS